MMKLYLLVVCVFASHTAAQRYGLKFDIFELNPITMEPQWNITSIAPSPTITKSRTELSYCSGYGEKGKFDKGTQMRNCMNIANIYNAIDYGTPLKFVWSGFYTQYYQNDNLHLSFQWNRLDMTVNIQLDNIVYNSSYYPGIKKVHIDGPTNTDRIAVNIEVIWIPTLYSEEYPEFRTIGYRQNGNSINYPEGSVLDLRWVSSDEYVAHYPIIPQSLKDSLRYFMESCSYTSFAANSESVCWYSGISCMYTESHVKIYSVNLDKSRHCYDSVDSSLVNVNVVSFSFKRTWYSTGLTISNTVPRSIEYLSLENIYVPENILSSFTELQFLAIEGITSTVNYSMLFPVLSNLNSAFLPIGQSSECDILNTEQSFTRLVLYIDNAVEICNLSNAVYLTELAFIEDNNVDWSRSKLPSSLLSLHFDSSTVRPRDLSNVLRGLDSLSSLSFQSNYLQGMSGEDLPEKLTSLSLISCSLEQIPDFSQLKQLKHLDLSKNDIGLNDRPVLNVLFNSLSKEIITLKLSDCSILDSLPEDIYEYFPNLKVIDFSNNYFFTSNLDLSKENSIPPEVEISSILAVPNTWESWFRENNPEVYLGNNQIQGSKTHWIQYVDLSGNLLWSCPEYGNEQNIEIVQDCRSNPYEVKFGQLDLGYLAPFTGITVLSIKFRATECPFQVNEIGVTFTSSRGGYNRDLTFDTPGDGFRTATIDLRSYYLKYFAANEEKPLVSIEFCQVSIQAYIDVLSFCERGKFVNLPEGADATDKQCHLCSLGRYSSIRDAEECLECSIGSYSDNNGSSSCTTCFENGKTESSGSISNSSCFCIEGYFIVNNSRCLTCPEGAICPENSAIPIVPSGYWMDMDLLIIYECFPNNACEFTLNGTTYCSESYTGLRCSKCAPGFYRLDHNCELCPSSSYGSLVFLCFLVLFAVFATLKSSVPSSSRLHSIGVTLSWIQILSLFSSLPVDWPWELQTLFDSLSFFNFNIDLFSPECAIELDFLTKWKLQILSPMILIVLLGLIFAIQIILGRIYPKYPNVFTMNFRHYYLELQRYNNWIQRNCFGKELEALPARDYAVEDEYRKSRYIYCFFYIITTSYTFLCSTVLQPLQCVRQYDGTYIMKFDTAFRCFDDQWFNDVSPFLYTSILIYILGIPLLIMVVFHNNHDNVFTSQFLKYYGTLIQPYRLQAFRFELLSIVKKFAIVISVDFASLSGSQYSGVFTCLIFMFVFAIISIRYLPYRNPANNTLTLLWIIVSIFCLFSSVVFQNSNLSAGETSTYAAAVTGVFIVGCVFSLMTAFFEARDGIYILRTESVEHQSIFQVTHTYEIELKELFPKSNEMLANFLSKESFGQRAKFFTDIKQLQLNPEALYEHQRERLLTLHHDFHTRRRITVDDFVSIGDDIKTDM